MGLEMLAVPLSAALIGFGVVGLVVHALVCLTLRVSSFKNYTAKQMLIAFVVMIVNIGTAGGKMGLRTMGGILRWWLFFAMIFIIFSGLYVTFTEYPEVWIGTARLYNRNIGPYVHQVVVVPLQITDVLLRGLLPIWNSGVWFIKAFGVQGLLPVVLKEIELVLKMAQTLISFTRHVTVALFAFVESFFCIGQACLHPEIGVIDVLSSLGDVREFVALGVQLLRSFCGILAAPVDLVIFPLMDLNLAEAVHNLVNSVIQLLVVIPRATVERCALQTANQFSVLMCTPDLSPFFNFLVAGVSSLGLAVDNWINVAFLIVQETITHNSPKCDGTDSGGGFIPDEIMNDRALFGAGARTMVVGLTDWLYAVTDGKKAVYAGHAEGSNKVKIQSWPFPGMDVSLGVAAVTYSSVHDLDVSDFSSGKTAGSMQTTAMLACNCTNQAGSMVILCSILPMTGVPPEAAPEDYLLQVLFPNTLVSSLYTCQGVDLYVKSVRWSFTRYQTEDVTLGSAQGDKTTLPTNDCISRGTCRELDATVWLVPRCGQDNNLNSGEGCTPTATCIPFCMAARSAGSGRDNLVLASAARWRKGLTVLGQDCAMATATTASVGTAMGRTGIVSRAATTVSGLIQSNGVAVHGFTYEAKMECKRATRMTSVIDKPEVQRFAANVGLSGQPFAITGDTLMTEVDLGGGALSVQVERLEGNEVDVFSLNSLNQELPAHPRALVPQKEADFQDTQKLVIPYSYQTARIAAVNSRNYVFYASNPPMDVFGAYFEYCHILRHENNKLGKMGLLLKSSYSPIRVYRVSAYKRCAAYSCGEDLVNFITIDGFSLNFTRACDEVFNVAVVGLEYLNEDNVAVIVQSSSVDEYNGDTGVFDGPNTQNKILWLNPSTMRVKDTIWQTSVPSTNFGALCPSIQKLPRAGSFASELINSVVFVFRFAVYSVLYTPGMVPVWRNGGICPQAGGSMYHSILGNCGDSLYSLDDFFDSVDDAAAIFWHSLSLIGQLIAPNGKGSVSAPITDVLDGMSQYGQGSIDLWAAGMGVMTLTRVPIKEQMTQLWATIQSGTSGKGVQGLASGGAGIIAWSRYSYRALSVIAIDITKKVLDPVEVEKLTVTSVFKLIWADLYDLRDEFSTTITSRVRMGCGGLRLMFGLSNPWSDLIYHQCMASAELTDDLMGLALNIFVQIPMAKCVCKDSAGQDLASFVTQVCAPPLPISLLPTLFMIANQVGSGKPTCELVLDSVKGSISKSMDSWFSNQYKALDALGSSVEYATASFDPGAGKCMDFQHDPHVVVIVPWPVDYFQQCSKTSRCKQVCVAEWDNFQAVMAPPVSNLPSFSVSTESMFFPGEVDTELQLTNVQAVVELPASSGVCYTRVGSASPADYVIVVAEVSWPAVRVDYWCAPRMPSLTVYKNDSAGYAFAAVEGTLMSMQFGDDSGEWLAVLVQLGSEQGQAVLVLNRTGIFAAPGFDDILPSSTVLMRVANLWVIDGVMVVDLVTRQMQVDADTKSAHSQAGVMHAFIRRPFHSQSYWMPTDVDLMQFGNNQYWYTRLNRVIDTEYLFLPKRSGLNLHCIRFAVSNSYIRQIQAELWSPTDLSTMTGSSLSINSQAMSYVFATSNTGWDWLKQIRWPSEGPGVDGVFGSAKIDVEVQIKGNCNERGCEGCKTVPAQRFCMAYSKCALINCVGTPVHQRRPLCGIGGLLQHSGGMSLQSTHAAWTVFSEMLGLTLQLTLMNTREAHLLWPEDSFLCYICQAKDSSAEFFSILTATVNSALQLGGANIGYMYGGASNVDTNADAALTISSTALNAFMHQIALFPLYGMVASHQIMMCQVTGVLALMNTSGFRLELFPSGEASPSETIAGQCLTVGAEILANYPSDNPSGLGYTIMSIASNALQLLLIQQIEPFLHFFDASLAYAIGVVHTLGVLVMSQSMAKCNPPDFYLKDIVKCACNDHRLQIPLARRNEKAIEGALWCNGVLSMVDSNNQPYYVYNPYTYAQLQEMSHGMTNYTSCVADSTSNQGYMCPVPNNPFFKAQGVTLLNVLVKCRENYVKKRWDPASYMMYQEKYDNLLKLRPTRVDRVLSPDPLGVRACLQGDTTGGSIAQGCLQSFFSFRDISSEEYWAYERTDNSHPGPEYTDACQTFTGPAQVLNLSDFASCVDGTVTGQSCRLSGHIWTPLSKNNVAVAEQHTVMSHGLNKDGMVQLLYKQASDMVMEAVKDSLAARGAGKEQPPIELEFFSVEGDVLHQTMDCIFMGPYSRIDYWPIPVCEPGEECLVGPYWSRDDTAGGSRNVDATSCQAESSLPFTCGSPARRSIMRYLVKDVLPFGTGKKNNNLSLANQVIVKSLESIMGDWNDTSTFGCDCGNGHFWPQCCPENATRDLLPPSLQKKVTQINSSHVLDTLEDDFGNVYSQALEEVYVWQKYMALSESDKFDWSNKERVRAEARFNPTRPVTNYTEQSDSLKPLREEDSSLWDVCHAALKQVFFTLPTKDGTVHIPEGTAPFDGDPDKLQDYVKLLLARAWEDSPLYRHYSPRHAPSPSQMCVQTEATDHMEEGEVSYSDFRQRARLVLSGASLSNSIPAFDPQRFRVGVTGGCICGWHKLLEDRCLVPSTEGTDESVCSIIACEFIDHSWTYRISNEGPLWEHFAPGWHCPEFELSPHWGFMDSETMEQWLGRNQTALMTSSRDLFTHGRSGLRAGNLARGAAGLPDLTKKYLNPTTREVPLERGRLKNCQPPQSIENLTQDWLDELFPAAQAVEEAGATAYCLRYTIELARLEIFRLLNQVDLEAKRDTQKEVVATWKRRCGAQLHLLHLCRTLGVYKPILNTDRKAPPCPHFQHVEIRYPMVVYTTPQCLVSVDGVFFDPCRCMDCLGEGSNRSINIMGIVAMGDRCKLRWDPLSMLVKEGPPIGWMDGEHPLGDDPVTTLLRDEFGGEILEDQDAVGNVRWDASQKWWAVDGLMSDSGDFCEGVLDWWDESWDFPVGYHVTLPCDSSETAYRSFFQSFAWDSTTNLMVYQHDLLRNESLADSHSGVGGLCRSTNFGMPMYETNNMRYCTKIPLDDTADFTLPVDGASGYTGGWTDMKCSTSSRDLPWPDSTQQAGYHQAARFSVGTVPNMPEEDSMTYPATEDDMFPLGPWNDIQAAGDRWGTGERTCQDFELLLCSDESVCPSGYRCRGMMCTGNKALVCSVDSDCPGLSGPCKGVCLEPLVECLRHEQCDSGMMCSGVGTCMQAVLSVDNKLISSEESISFSLATNGDCQGDTREYTLAGGSFWGNTGQDVLQVHGMCSYENWFKYTQIYKKGTCSTLASDGSFDVDPSKCLMGNMDLPTINQSRWWPAVESRPELMYLRPTDCDRDYERLKGFKQCAPLVGQATLVASDSVMTIPEFDKFVRLHDTANKHIRLADMPEADNLTFGFLGLNGAIKRWDQLSTGENPFVQCATVGQCYPATFTVNGTETNRSYYDDMIGRWVDYPLRTPFTCGAFGLEDPGKQGCKLDLTVLPLYKYLCVSGSMIQSCRQLIQSSVNQLCSNIQFEYQASNQDRASVLSGLRELFFSFPGFQDIDGYLDITTCASEIHTKIMEKINQSPKLKVSPGLYYPMMFSLYEFPFSWFFQCLLLAGGKINEASRKPQDCRAFRDRMKHGITTYTPISPEGDSYDIYLLYVQGGYTRKNYLAYQESQAKVAEGVAYEAYTSVKKQLYGENSEDTSYPQCSTNRLWKVGEYGDALPDFPNIPDLRALIWNWYDKDQSCSANWQLAMILDLPASFGFTKDNWVDKLTYPDPTQLVAQDGVSGNTLLDHVTFYLLDSIGMAALPEITGTSGGALWFNHTPAAEYDFKMYPIESTLYPKPSRNPGVTSIDDTVSQTCAFLPVSDPAFSSVPRAMRETGCSKVSPTSGMESLGRKDTLRMCGNKVCSQIPVLYARNGKFNCGYKAAGGIIPGGCDETNPDERCINGVVTALYKEVVERYTTSISFSPVLAPELFPWFTVAGGQWESFESFDLSLELDYASNIQPNPDRAVMCQLTSKEDAIDFTECSSPHFARLKQHVNTYYKHEGPVIVPSGTRLEWPIHRIMLNQGVVLSYSNMNRDISKTYLDALFDEDTVCRAGNAQQVCWRKGMGEFVSMNPWLLGKFNPFEVCDVDFTDQGEGGREYVYAACDPGNEVCSRYLQQPVPNQCKQYHMSWVQMQGVPRYISGQSLDYNLCFHKLEEDPEGCLHDQGMLGGFDGLPVGTPTGSTDAKMASNLYGENEWNLPNESKRGLFGGLSGLVNPLWEGKEWPYGHLKINEFDIGGHRIEMEVYRVNGSSDSFSVLQLKRLPLGDDIMADTGGKNVSEWVPKLAVNMKEEDSSVERLYPVKYSVNSLGASCPLQRWIFYSGEYKRFSPPIPSPQRASHMFHRIHGGLRSHPTMQRGLAGESTFMGRYRSSNGFCACPKLNDIEQPQCLIPTTDSGGNGPCTLDQTVRSLLGGIELQSYVFIPRDHMRAEKRCTMQLDWPNVDGTLRDGTKLETVWDQASSPSHRECHILDRFKPFKYKYQSVSSLKPLGKNTLQEGVCKTGRVVTWDASVFPRANSRCLRKFMDESSATFSCNTSTTPLVLTRRKRLSLAETLQSSKRRKQGCSRCSKPPGFTSERGEKINPESSFGMLARPASVEAMLAKDLKEALCPKGLLASGAGCPTLNMSAWTRGNFMRNYMRHPERLFVTAKDQPKVQAQEQPLSPKKENSSRWDTTPWVYCPTAEALASGKGCVGTITRSQWEKSRVSLCPRMVHSFSRATINGSESDPMARAPFCVLDNTTERVCQAVMDARALVRQANCIAKGNMSCMPNPFVYHPASYEPSNNAWVHDTVRDYYKKVSGDIACPTVTQTDNALLVFSRRYQQSCPANAVVLMEGVLMTVRVVVTDVALLLTSVLSMIFRTLGLFFTSGASGLKRGIRANWMYIKSKGRAIISSASELLVDAMLNSGEMGHRILTFLDDTCTKVNDAIAWFMRVWCDYIQKYMVQVLFGLRKAMGMIATGFDIVQDFADELFQGVLPASFVEKYAEKDFKKAMQEKYSKPSEHADKVAAKKNVPKSINIKTKSVNSAAKNSIVGTSSKVSGVFKTISKNPVSKALKGAGYIGAALTMLDIASSIMTAIEEDRLRKLWPADFTLFDFSDVVNVLDDMESFLLLDDSCYTYQIYQNAGLDYKLFPCLDASLASLTAEGSTVGTTSLDATRCWATAYPSLGQNSLFSCSASSTCCETSACTKFIVCGTCPAPQLPDTNQYGCESLQEKCMCGLARSSISKCVANRQCDREAQCEMISSLSGLSYGTIPCKSCPSQRVVMCLLPPSGMPAKCACMLNKDMEYDLCGNGEGARTIVNNQKLCGYLPSQSPTSSRWSFDMDDLIIVPCIQVSEGVCSTVFNAGTVGTIRMVVAAVVRSSASSRGRRLLWDEQVIPEPGPPTHHVYESEYELVDSHALHELLTSPGWNTTAAPCSSLALAYQEDRVKLGVLETFTLHKCAYWRYVGRRVIQRYNLSAVMQEHETFLLSMDDLVYALMSPHVGWEILKQPSVIGTIMLYHPWLKPLRAFGVMVANKWEQIHWLREIDSDVHDALFGDVEPGPDNDASPDEPEPIERTVRPRFPTRIIPGPSATVPTNTNYKNHKTGGRSRSLLSVQDTINSIPAFTGQTIVGAPSVGASMMYSKIASAWSTAAFVWPPRYDYSANACPIAMSTLQMGRQVVLVNKLYFQHFDSPQPEIDRSLRGNLPSWKWAGEIKELPQAATGKAKSWASSGFHLVLDMLSIPPSHMLAFFTYDRDWSLMWVLDTTIHCDLASVLTCSRHNKDLIMSTVVFILLYILVSTITKTLGFGFLGILFLFSYPWFILWYTFGMAPTCFPMIPTCLLSDIIETIKFVLPPAIFFPDNLLCNPAEAGHPMNQTCLKSCEELNFTSWVDPLAFAVCDTDPKTCIYLDSLGNTGVELVDTLAWSPLRSAMQHFAKVVNTGGSALAGHRLCTWVSFVITTPILVLLVLALVLANALVASVLELIPSVVTFICQTYIFYRS